MIVTEEQPAGSSSFIMRCCAETARTDRSVTNIRYERAIISADVKNYAESNGKEGLICTAQYSEIL